MGTDESTDDQILYRIQSGDTSAWGEAFRAYKPMMTRIAGGSLSVRGGEALMGFTPDDVVMECFRKLIGKDLQHVISLRSYLASATKNTAIDMVRARATERRYADVIEVERLVASTEEKALLALQGERIRQRLDVLTPQQRVALVERVMKGRPAVDVGADLGVSGAAVAGLVRRALSRIRPLVAADMADDDGVYEEEEGERV
jgi:RNA polymerase sigma factor (sigma-70 family)